MDEWSRLAQRTLRVIAIVIALIGLTPTRIAIAVYAGSNSIRLTTADPVQAAFAM